MDNSVINSIIMEETLELVLVFDKQGNILCNNRSAREKLGYTEEELNNCNMTEIFLQEFECRNKNEICFDIKKIEDIKETVMYRKNSACFPVALRFFTLEDGNCCLLAEDITLRKNMDVRVRQLKDEEEENKRQRNEFTANVTHELRTPVNGIKGHATTLLDMTEDEKHRRILEIIVYCCDNMSAIINNILDFSKMEAGKFSLDENEFDFYKMMDRVISTHMAEINKKELQISVYIDKNIPHFIIGDALRISQILNNLLSNAVKFTLVGCISVDVSMTMQMNDEVELFFMVRDSGIGISKEEQERLFQSFRQADASITRRFGGTGLGLSITKQLVEMMNGAIHVESEKGSGSCFSFNIKLRTSGNVGESQEFNDIYKKWAELTTDNEQDSRENYLEFGSENNIIELKKRMEKLILSIELGSWEKAEMLADTIKALVAKADEDVRRKILKMEMAVRKENYEKSISAYEQAKSVLMDKFEM